MKLIRNTISYFSLIHLLLLLSAFVVINERKTTIYLIGDSTMADKRTDNGNLERGWGQMLPHFLTEDIIVSNHAMNGRSSLSFINEGRWEKVLSELQQGDYVFIQFGHNDEKQDSTLHSVPGGSFDENLRRFVRETRDKGAFPVLLNSVVRRNYPPPGQKKHEYTYETEGNVLVDTHGEYAESPRRIAKELNVPFVDMTHITHELVEKLGPEDSKKLFMWIEPGIYESHPKGKVDNTHLNIYGAKVIARIAIEAVAGIVPQLASFVRNIDPEIYVANYKDDKACAISYTFDDGLQEHYTLVYPQLEEHGFKGTFWICGNTIENEDARQGKPRMTWSQMKEMSDKGHEISNHSWSHPNLTKYTEAKIRREIEKNDSIIEANIGKKCLTFCYPGNYYNKKVKRIASEGRVGTRTNQKGIGGEVAGSTTESLDRWVKDLIITESWGVAMIHGITYAYDAFTTPHSPETLWEHFRQVKAQKENIWVDTFEMIATYTKTRNNTRLDICKDDKSIRITPRSSLDRKLFSQPLTMVIRIPQYASTKARQDGKILPVNVCSNKAVFEFNPYGGEIVLTF